MSHDQYAVASISRLLKIIGLFCKRVLWKRLYSAKETYNFREPTNRSHPIWVMSHRNVSWLTWAILQWELNDLQAAFAKDNKVFFKGYTVFILQWGHDSHESCYNGKWYTVFMLQSIQSCMSHMNESCPNRWWTTCKQPSKEPVWMSPVTNEWVMSGMNGSGPVWVMTHVIESCHIRTSHVPTGDEPLSSSLQKRPYE